MLKWLGNDYGLMEVFVSSNPRPLFESLVAVLCILLIQRKGCKDNYVLHVELKPKNF